ncbi:MAG: ImmA/IrrE family metallo-endopeptidase [Kofleriaceae bacterium]
MRAVGIGTARAAARALSRRFGVRSAAHINLEAFVAYLGVRIVEARLDGAIAQLVRVGREVTILVSDRVTDVCARRFSIAHELGHFVLAHPSCAPHELAAPRQRARRNNAVRDYEAEANAFAGELLMPYELVRRRCDVSPVSLDVPWAITREFNVSILASARQFVALSPERCAAVFSNRSGVVWIESSPTFTRQIEPGKPLDRDSVAWDFFASGQINDRAQPVPADAWFDTSAQVEIVEHSHASHEHRTVISLLWIPDRVAGPLGM